MFKLLVERYNKTTASHECEILEHDDSQCYMPGNHAHIDLLVHCDFPKDTDPESLIGKTYTVDRAFGYIFIGQGVVEVEAATEVTPKIDYKNKYLEDLESGAQQ